MVEGTALFRRYPALADRIPWLSLGSFPTPVHALDTAATDLPADLWVKRDDLAGTLYGGNKVRKLEFLLADAERQGARRLITIGAAGSHHALATTVYGLERGFRITLVLFPQPLTEHARRGCMTDAALGAEIRWAPSPALVPAHILLARLRHRAERPLVVPAGGSNRVGTLGYVSGALELAEQIAAGAAPAPARIHVAGGTLGTAAGLALGLALAGLEPRLVVTQVVESAVTNRRRLVRLVAGASELLGAAGVEVPPVEQVLARTELDPAQLGAGYGHATAAGREAQARLARAGLPLEPTYTAKTAASLLASGSAADGPVLFWNTFSSVEPVPPDPPLGRPPAPARRYLAGAVGDRHAGP